MRPSLAGMGGKFVYLSNKALTPRSTDCVCCVNRVLAFVGHLSWNNKPETTL